MHCLRPRYQTLVEALLAAPPERQFVAVREDEDEYQTVTFGEFVRDARSRAALLRRHGVGCGDTVVLVMQQGLPLMTTFAVVPTSAGPGVPCSRPVAESNVAHDGLLAMLNVSAFPSGSEAAG